MGGKNEKKKRGMVKKYCSTKLEKTNIGGQDRNENRNLRDIFLCCVFFKPCERIAYRKRKYF